MKINKINRNAKTKITLCSLFTIIILAAVVLPALAFSTTSSAATSNTTPLTLTSITLDPENASGYTTNAPGAWSTNTGDPLCQVGVTSKGIFQNQGADTGVLGEISIPLKNGLNTLNLVGNGVFPFNPYYGAILFFDGQAVGPQIAVFNQNGNLGDFQVQPANAVIMGGANGGIFFDTAPGYSGFVCPDGSVVEVVYFAINSISSNVDKVSFAHIGSDGTPDTTATLILNVIPAPAPFINSFSPSQTAISPNGDNVKDSTTLQATFNVAVNWVLTAKSSSGLAVRTWTGNGAAMSADWDGKDNSGLTVTDGLYTLTLNATNLSGTQSTTKSIPILIDTQAPTITATTVNPASFDPTVGQTTTVSYSLSEICFVNMDVHYYNSTCRTLLTNANQLNGNHTVVWNGKSNAGTFVSPSTYAIVITAVDSAGNKASQTTLQAIVD
jgi:flagellar hook assembly protein FlgD